MPIVGQGRRFQMGFYQDMGDVSTDPPAQPSVAFSDLSLGQQIAALQTEQAATDIQNAYYGGAQAPPTQDVVSLMDLAKVTSSVNTTGATTGPSGTPNAVPGNTAGADAGAFDFLKSAFGSLVNAGAAVAPAVIAAGNQRSYSPLFGNSTQAPKPAAPAPGMSTGTKVGLGLGALGLGYLLFGKSLGLSRGTKTNPKGKGKKRKGGKKHRSSGKKRSGGKKRKGGKRKGSKKGKKR